MLTARRLVQKFERFGCPWLPSTSQQSTKFFLHLSAISRRKKFVEPLRFKPKSSKPGVRVWSGITISDLAAAMNRDVDEVFEAIFRTEYRDVFESPNQELEDQPLISNVVKLLGFKPEFISGPSKGIFAEFAEEDKDAYPQPPPDPEICVARPPILTIMGHVDHGKTTLLDALRKSQIVDQEFGGITQHIGAFSVKLADTDRTITFLDTPGHAAFKSMRRRGANCTDIVVLVVAADDGIMEQTLESIKYAREADVPIIVAINKCDKPQADVERTKRQLLAEGIHLEDFDGDVQAICISAKQKTGIKELQEAILAQADFMELKGDPNGLVEAIVIESKAVHGKGKVATIIVQRGTLKRAKILVAGTALCRVRTLYDENGKQLNEVKPGNPVEITGWRDELPGAGEQILELENEHRAKEVISFRQQRKMRHKADADAEVIEKKREEHQVEYQARRKERLRRGLREFQPFLKEKPVFQRTVSVSSGPRLGVLVKGDVDGSVEAILEVLATYNSNKCTLDIIGWGVGPLTDKELELAKTFTGMIYLFNTPTTLDMLKKASSLGVPVKEFNIIYRLVEDLKKEFDKQLPLIDEEKVSGEGFVLTEFLVTEHGSKKRPVAGVRCVEGQFNRKLRFRVTRGETIVYDGEATSMQKEKDVVNLALKNEEVGLMFTDKEARFEPDDHVVCYEVVKVAQHIDWKPPGF